MQEPDTMTLRTYEVNVKGQNWAELIVRGSAGAAKYAYLQDIRDSYPEMTFMDLTVRSLGNLEPDESFIRVARYRDVPYAELGMRVKVEDDEGFLVGSNSASNFDVLFTTGKYAGHVFNCHPNFKIKYFNSADEVIGEF
jgi:hypothetical protein